MASCTFFGHRQIINDIKPLLKTVLTELIENYNVNTFYVGNQGSFDKIVTDCLKLLSQQYSNITYTIVLAYLPTKTNTDSNINHKNSLYLQELENVPPKFAINKRNEWMLNRSEFVVTYVEFIVGGAKKFQDIANKKGKTVINLADIQS